MEAVDRVGGDLNGGVEAEGHLGAAEVVVDGLGHADHGKAVLAVKAVGDAERVLAADGDQAVDVEALERRADGVDAVVALERVGPRGAEDRAAAGQDPARDVVGQRLAVAVQRAAPAVAEAEDLVAVVQRGLAHDRADDRVEAGAVAATGEDADAHTSGS